MRCRRPVPKGMFEEEFFDQSEWLEIIDLATDRLICSSEGLPNQFASRLCNLKLFCTRYNGRNCVCARVGVRPLSLASF